jgi:hypothetical protein
MIIYKDMVEPSSDQLPRQVQGFEGEKGVQFRAGIEKEFREINEERYGYIREFGLKDGKGEDEIAYKINSLKNSLDEKSFKRRIQYVTNNFRFWWPEGWYRVRDAMISLEKKAESDPETMEALEKIKRMTSDMDKIIQESGYGNMNNSVKAMYSKDENNEGIVSIVGDVYLKMRQLGYDRETLVA